MFSLFARVNINKFRGEYKEIKIKHSHLREFPSRNAGVLGLSARNQESFLYLCERESYLGDLLCGFS